MLSFNRWHLPSWAYSSIKSEDDEEASLRPTRERKSSSKTLAKQQLLLPTFILLLAATAFGLGALFALQYRDITERISSSRLSLSQLSPSSMLSWPKTPVPDCKPNPRQLRPPSFVVNPILRSLDGTLMHL